MQSSYNSLDASFTKVNIEAQGLASQLASLDEEMATLYREADQLRLEWLELVDPWGDLDRDDHEAAITTFSEWIVLDGQNADAFIARGIAYMRLG